MTDSEFWAWVVLALLTLWTAACLAFAAFYRAAPKPAAWPSAEFYDAHFAGRETPITGRDLYGQMAAMWAPEVVEAAERVAKEAVGGS